MGYDGIDAYKVDTFKDALHLTKFTELCYKQGESFNLIKKMNEINERKNS
jgi:hypothetical protein